MDWDEEAISDDSGSDYCASEESITEDEIVAESESAFIGSSDSESQEPDYDSQADARMSTRRSDRNKRKKVHLNVPEKSAKRRRYEEPAATSDAERPRRRRLVLKPAKRSSDDEQVSRPRRVAARNALSMFSSMNEEDEEPVERVPESDELRNGGAETSEAGECRRPRSQRKLVLKLRNRPVREPVPSAEASEEAKQEAGSSSPEFRATVVHDSEDGLKRSDRRTRKKAKLADTSSESEDAVKKRTRKKAKLVDSSSDDGPPMVAMNGLKGKEVEEVAGPSSPFGCASPSPSAEAEEAEAEEPEPSPEITTQEAREQDQMTFSNESLQNGETPDDDPDYREEAEAGGKQPQDSDDSDYHEEAGGKQPEDSDSDAAEQEDEEDEEEEEEEDESDDGGGRSRHKGRRRNGLRGRSRRPAAPVSRRKSRRIAKSVAAGSNRRMSTRNRPSKFMMVDGSSSENEASDWSDRDRNPKRTAVKVALRSSARLRQPPLGRRVDYRYEVKRRGKEVTDRNQSKIAWLLSTDVDRLRYIPQFGDQVVYFRQGHQSYLEEHHSKEVGPWSTFKSSLLAVEYCQVVGLEYIIGPSGETSCELTLEFTEGNPATRGSNFTLCLPELTEHSDFVVERSRYDDCIARGWSIRDKCLVWWRLNETEGGWWEGRIKQLKPKSTEFPTSPWDSVMVRYKAEPDSDTPHSPWELFESEDYMWDAPRLDDDSSRILLDRLNEVLTSSQTKDEYGLWTLQQAITKPDFYYSIPLPLSMDIIKARVENKYYRSLEAVLHDLNTLISNFRLYFGESHQSVHKVERLSERFSDILGMS